MARAPVYELCSVDVWDTLLRRRCHPDAVKLHIAKVLLGKMGDDIVAPLRDSRALLKLRLGVEAGQARAARTAGFDDEYRHEDVLAEWLARAAPVLDEAGRAGLVVELAQEEWRQEVRVSYPDPGLAAVLDRIEARRWLFVSDFYMSSERLRALLDSKGVAARFEAGISSADVKLNKRSGRLFQHLHRQYHIAPAQHCHVGDSPEGDLRTPRRLGMKAVHYTPRRETRARRERERWLEKPAALHRVLEDRCRALKPDRSGRAAEAWRYGARLAPLFAGFAQFVVERAQRDRVQRLLFCTREGAFFARACAALGASPLPAESFAVSRHATFAASLGALGEGMERLWRAFPHQSIRAWTASLGLAETAIEPACARLGLVLDAPVTDSAGARLDDARVIGAIHDCVARRRAELEAYLGSLHLPAQGRVGLVDIGWRGSIEDNLALLRSGTEWHGYYLGLQEFLDPPPANACKSAYGPDLNRSKEGARLFRNLPLLEMVCMAPGGTVKGYSAEGQPVRDADAAEDASYHDLVCHLQDGVIAGIEVWAEAIRVHALCASDLRAEGLARWQALLSSTPRFLRDALARHKHDESFGRGRFAPVGKKHGRLARLFSGRQEGRVSTTKA